MDVPQAAKPAREKIDKTQSKVKRKTEEAPEDPWKRQMVEEQPTAKGNSGAGQAVSKVNQSKKGGRERTARHTDTEDEDADDEEEEEDEDED
jgi:hypothetical protein